MARTFNRPPYTLNTPSNSDIKTNSFIHTNWKGINIDKNFLEADQQTFADAKNVYVDSEGLLRSRPSSKITHIRTNDGTLSNIVDVWVFEHVKIYMTENEQKYKLHIFNGDNILEIDTVKNIKLVLVEQKIFLFTETSLHYYDVNTNEYFDAENYIYVPVKTLYKNNTFIEYETENELTSSYRNRYLFEKVDDLNFEKLIGKNVIITIGDVEYNVNFVQNNQVVFVEKKMQLSNNNFISIPNLSKYPLVSVSENDVCIISTCNNSSLKGVNTYDIYCTIDFVTFNRFPTIEGVTGLPKISKDGFYAYCMKDDDLYVISTADRGQDYYTEWKPLLQNYYKEFYTKYGKKPWYDYLQPFAEMDSLDVFVIHCNPRIGFNSKNAGDYVGIIYCNEGNIDSMYTNMRMIASRVEDHDEILDYSYKLANIDVDTGKSENIIGEIKHVKYATDEYVTTNDKIDVETGKLQIIYSNKYIYQSNIRDVKIVITKEDDSFIYTITGYVDVLVTFTDNFKGVVNYHKRNYNFEKVVRSYLNHEISFDFEGSTFSFIDGVFKCETSDEWIAVDVLNTGYSDIESNTFSGDIPNIKIYKYDSSCNVLIDNGTVEKIDVNTKTIKIYNFNYVDPASVNNDITYCPLINDIYYSEDVVKFIKRNINPAYGDSRAYILFEYSNNKITHKYVESSYYVMGKFDRAGNLVTSGYLYLNDTIIPMLFDAMPVFAYNHLYLCTLEGLYSNNWNYEIIVDELVKGENKYLLPEYVTELSNIYFSKNKTLYISKYPSDGIFKWYFPKLNTEEFDYKITNLHPISPTEMAVFTNSNVYYVQTTENGYMYYKSKIQVGCKDGSDVMTTYDGVYTIFASSRGLVAMTYQQFVATTEQALSYLTDGIYELYNKFNDKPVKLFKHLFWIVCYKEGASEVLLFDTRNNSWWFNSGKYKFNKIVESDNNVFLLMNNDLFVPNTTDINYYDFDGTKSQIEWFIKSQKLHLNSLDYQKNIRDITLVSVLDSDTPINLNLQITNYRKTVKEGNEQLLEYRVDSIRTFVKHLNCMKVNQIQYVLKNNEEAYIQIPLSLSSLSIKYRITRQVR